MFRVILAAAMLFVATPTAQALIVCNDRLCFTAKPETTQHAHRSVDANGNPTKREINAAVKRGYCRETTPAGGTVILDCGIAPRMMGFIRDVMARGFRGRVHCFALSGHVPRSQHYRAKACDFAQRGWGKTVRVMHHVAGLAEKWGLRDGCSFHGRRGPDCGHIDGGL